ncbi:hypothetical protein AB9E19_33820, partial [Rhizobium leguminosarum]|uniref:hypothetical protein n=1 Tax=Rhizobium leguminosarum TaxID=384 RepID=UPI003F9BCDF9
VLGRIAAHSGECLAHAVDVVRHFRFGRRVEIASEAGSNLEISDSETLRHVKHLRPHDVRLRPALAVDDNDIKYLEYEFLSGWYLDG